MQITEQSALFTRKKGWGMQKRQGLQSSHLTRSIQLLTEMSYGTQSFSPYINDTSIGRIAADLNKRAKMGD